MTVAAFVVLGILAAILFQGYSVGAHVWRLGWTCGQTTYTDFPFCTRDPRGGM